jgi:hypothetical protein
MSILYVAASKTVADWAADVGLTKHVYKVGVADEPAEDVAKALNDSACAGGGDWKILKKEAVDGIDEAAVIARVAQKEKMVDPGYYPRIRGAQGLFRVKISNVANHLLVKRALAGEEQKVDKVKTPDIAAYLLQAALG